MRVISSEAKQQFASEENSALAIHSNFSPYIDETVKYSPADLKQHAECHQQQEDGAGVTTEWP